MRLRSLKACTLFAALSLVGCFCIIWDTLRALLGDSHLIFSRRARATLLVIILIADPLTSIAWEGQASTVEFLLYPHEVLLGVAADLGPGPCTNEILNLLPVFAVQSEGYMKDLKISV